MMPCLIPSKITEFRKALKEKRIDLAKLLNMTSEQRTELLREFAGNDAKTVNLLFEQKLLLKNKMLGIKNWASKMGQIGKYDPLKKAELDKLAEEYKAKQEERLFNPKEDEAFLSDVVEQRLGTKITREEAKTLFNLANQSEKKLEKFDGEDWKSEKDKSEYGASKVAYENYVEYLKSGNEKSLKELFGDRLEEAKIAFKENKTKAIADLLGDAIKTISDNSISMVASFDNSFLGRQGLKTLMTHPTAWVPGAKNSFVDFAKTLGGNNMKDALMADIYSKPNYINGRYEDAKIIAKSEEQYPSLISEKTPVIGRAIKASESAFTGSALRMRTDLFDLLSREAEKNGVEMNKKQVEDIGRIVNSLTARGSWGKRGDNPLVRAILWAPKMIKANIDVLTAHGGTAGLETKFAKKEAVKNLVKVVGTIATIMMISRAFDENSVELDPRSSNFGKLKFGDTTFDITGGAGSLVTLAARMVMNSTKSTTTGAVTEYGSEYGQTSREDAFVTFLEGKTTPPIKVLLDMMKGETFEGKKPTIEGEIYSAVTPISLQNAIKLKDNSSADAVLGVFLDLFGISANTYNQTTDWNQSTGAELQQFKQKVGDEKFQKANDEYNKLVSDWLKQTIKSESYKKMSDDEKKALITKNKDKIKSSIFSKYNFKYKKK